MTEDHSGALSGSRASHGAPTGLHPSGFDPARIPWHLGSTDESYGTAVWFSRVENLLCHLRIIADYLPEEAIWLQGQVRAAIAEAERYLADWSPLASTHKD